jgi:DNA-binding transcriptional regulator YhcF (GntR family)
MVHAMAMKPEASQVPADEVVEQRTAVYRLYDSAGRLLYVGITNDPKVRWLAHAGDKAWWSEVARRDVEWVPDRSTAVRLEGEAIRMERPIHNVKIPNPAQPPRMPQPKLHQEIANELRQRIFDGSLAPGSRVPGENTLIATYGVSRSTARQALADLKEAGLTSTRQGAGVWVRDPRDRTLSVPVGRPAEAAELLRGAMAPNDLASLIGLLIADQ